MSTKFPPTRFATACKSPPILALFLASPLIAFLKCVKTSLVVLVWFALVLRYAIKSACVMRAVGAGEGDLPCALRRFEGSPPASESDAAPSAECALRLRFPEPEEEPGAGDVALFATSAEPEPAGDPAREWEALRERAAEEGEAGFGEAARELESPRGAEVVEALSSESASSCASKR